MKINAPTRKVNFEIDGATFHYFPDPESSDPIDVDASNRESIEQAAEHLGMTTEAVEVLAQSFAYLKDRLRADLIDMLYELNPSRDALV